MITVTWNIAHDSHQYVLAQLDCFAREHCSPSQPLNHYCWILLACTALQSIEVVDFVEVETLNILLFVTRTKSFRLDCWKHTVEQVFCIVL